MQNMDHLADMTTGDTVRVSRLRAYCQAGRWWPMLREECHGDWAGEKYGNLEDPPGDRTLGRSFLTRSSELVSHVSRGQSGGPALESKEMAYLCR